MPSEAKDFGPFFHGTKADLQPGDLLEPGYGFQYRRAHEGELHLPDRNPGGGPLGVQNWRWARDPAGSTAWNPRSLLRMTPT